MHLHTLRRESRQKETEPNILTWCVGFRPFFPQSLPRFYPSDRAAALSESTYTLQCRFCVGDFHPVSLCFAKRSREAVFLNMPIFICKLIMNLFVHFVNTFTQKNSKNGSVPHRAQFEHVFLLPCSRCGAKCDL